MSSRLYEEIGRGYAHARRPEPSIAAVLDQALADAESVINVGAGAGSYEPEDRCVLAIEPAAQMRAQRPDSAAACIAGSAEHLPVPDASFGAAMAVYTDFHWSDRRRGIDEMRRVSRQRIVILTVDRGVSAEYWLFRDYFPSANELFAPIESLLSLLPTEARVSSVPIPHDCSDGFVHAFWKRPYMLLDPGVHGTMAAFAGLAPGEKTEGLDRLRVDLDSGQWNNRNQELAKLDLLDLGHRLVVWENPAA